MAECKAAAPNANDIAWCGSRFCGVHKHWCIPFGFELCEPSGTNVLMGSVYIFILLKRRNNGIPAFRLSPENAFQTEDIKSSVPSEPQKCFSNGRYQVKCSVWATEMLFKRKTSKLVFRLCTENAFQTEDIRASVPSGLGKRETDGTMPITCSACN